MSQLVDDEVVRLFEGRYADLQRSGVFAHFAAFQFHVDDVT